MITFHEIYERYAKDVFHYACWLSGSADEADDITSETFARAWAGRAAIRTETVKAYLFAIARNYYLQDNRKATRMAGLDSALSDPPTGPDQITQSPLSLGPAIDAGRNLSCTHRTAGF